MTGKPICSVLGAKLPTQSSCVVLQAASNWPLVSLVSLKSNGRSCCELPYLVKFPVICQSSWPLDDSATSQKGNVWQEDHARGKVLTAGRSNTVIAAEEEGRRGRASKKAWSGLLENSMQSSGGNGCSWWWWTEVFTRAVTKARGVISYSLGISYSLRWELLYSYSSIFLQYTVRLWFQKSLARLTNKLLFATTPGNWNKTSKFLAWWKCVCCFTQPVTKEMKRIRDSKTPTS